MQGRTSLTRYVRCETCGNRFQYPGERCPRCGSNQHACLPMVDAKLFARNSPSARIGRAGEPIDNRDIN